MADWGNQDQLVLNLGNSEYQPGYDSNDKGSYERNYNNILQGFTPDQLIRRYSQANIGTQLGTDADRAGYRAYSSFKSLIGRDPTSGELAQILPAFQGPNGAINGNAALANLQQQYKSNPNLDPTSARNNQNPADISANVSQQFRSILGRDATPEELAHFTQAIQSNQTDAYGLSSFLKLQPEYTNAQDKNFRSGLNSELAGYDTEAFNKQKGDIISAYARNGMAAGNSPSLDYALTDLMGKLASNRSAYLSQLSAAQYGGNKDLAIGNYQNSLNQMYNENQQRANQQAQYGQQLTNQGFAGADYQTQMNDYMRFMQNQPKQRGTNPFGTALQGAAAGSAAGPWGAGIGAGAGLLYGYLNQ